MAINSYSTKFLIVGKLGEIKKREIIKGENGKSYFFWKADVFYDELVKLPISVMGLMPAVHSDGSISPRFENDLNLIKKTNSANSSTKMENLPWLSFEGNLVSNSHVNRSGELVEMFSYQCTNLQIAESKEPFFVRIDMQAIIANTELYCPVLVSKDATGKILRVNSFALSEEKLKLFGENPIGMEGKFFFEINPEVKIDKKGNEFVALKRTVSDVYPIGGPKLEELNSILEEYKVFSNKLLSEGCLGVG